MWSLPDSKQHPGNFSLSISKPIRDNTCFLVITGSHWLHVFSLLVSHYVCYKKSHKSLPEGRESPRSLVCFSTWGDSGTCSTQQGECAWWENWALHPISGAAANCFLETSGTPNSQTSLEVSTNQTFQTKLHKHFWAWRCFEVSFFFFHAQEPNGYISA